tara:strand:+ start:6088 stop:6912 length:825 start_codon:yes stop_codon:yes gene_type:complete
MTTHGNIMVKNEEVLLGEVLPIWKNYPLEKFVFYNDNSTDNTVEIIKDHLGDRAVILNDRLDKFHESYNRSRMLEYSRENKAKYAIAFDCDELWSQNMVDNFDQIIPVYESRDIYLYWFNVVNDSLSKIRQDPEYINNYRSFILPLKHTGKFNMNDWKYHTPRTPPVSLPKAATKDFGIIHLQAINRRFYALKQLWYKHYEYKNYKHSIEFVNERYDKVVNNLKFLEVDTPSHILGNISFDPSVYDIIAEQKKYLQYIQENYVPELVTFGEEYL